MSHYWSIFANLIATPFEHASLIWGIVPLYFGLLLNELTADKASSVFFGPARSGSGRISSPTALVCRKLNSTRCCRSTSS
jgi:hypothetical protein